MRFLIILFILSTSFSSFAAPKLERMWARSTLQKPHNFFRYFNRMPPVLAQGLVIQGNAVDGIVAFDRDSGHQRWSLPFKNGVEGGATTDGETLFFGAGNGQLYSVSAVDGRLLWSFPLNAESLTRPTLQGDKVFHITGKNTVYAFDKKSGKNLWVKTNALKSPITVRGSTRPLYDSGTVYVGFSDGSFVALNSENGRELWRKRIGDDKKFNDVDSSAKISKNCLLVASYANALYCLDKRSGQIKWRHDEGAFNSVLAVDGRVLYPTLSGEIHVLDEASGKLLKKIVDIKGLSTEVLLLKDWIVYGESEGALVLRDRKTLEKLSTFSPGRGLFASPTVDSKTNEVYLLSNEANIFKVKVSLKGAHPFPWNKYQ